MRLEPTTSHSTLQQREEVLFELKAHWQEAVKNHRRHIDKIAITDNHLFERKLRKHNVKQTQKHM